MPCGCSQRDAATAYITAADVVNDDGAHDNQNEEGNNGSGGKLQHHKPPPRSTVITKTTKTTKTYKRNKLITTTVTATTTTTTTEPTSDDHDDHDDDDPRETDLKLPAADGTVAVRSSWAAPAVQPKPRSFGFASTALPMKIKVAPPAAAKVFKSIVQPAPNVVVRQEFRTLPYDEQLRFCQAMQKMMEVKSEWKPWVEGQVDPTEGPPPDEMMPCEYFRLASYHGWPYWGDKSGEQVGYCPHGIETFPIWHRAYVVEFERALQEADRALGRDGKIALHYWGWEGDDPFVNGQAMPTMIRDLFRDFKRDMIPSVLLESVCDCNMLKLMREGYKGISTDDSISTQISNKELAYLVKSAIVQLLHSRAATTQDVKYTARSIEQPHNLLHNLCGFPMSDVPVASFHPVFWLHHSNIDRIYEAYLQHAKKIGLDPEDQFSSCNNNLYTKRLDPFILVVDGKQEDVLPHTVFQNTEALGYLYSELPQGLEPIDLKPRLQPTMAVLDSIDFNRLRGRSLNFHVFLVKNGETFTPPTDAAALHTREDYAGFDAFLGGKNGPCATCDQRGLISMRVLVTENLKRRKLTRFDVRPEFLVETVGKNIRLKTLADLGLTAPENKPVIMGPLIDTYPHESRDGGFPNLFTPLFLSAGVKPETVSTTNQVAVFKYLAVAGYLGEKKRDAVIDPDRQLPLEDRRVMMAAMEGDTAEGEAGGESDDVNAAPAAAAPADGDGDDDPAVTPDGGTSAGVRPKTRRLDPSPIEGIKLAQTQLRLKPNGRLDVRTAIALADARRYNTLPQLVGNDIKDKATFKIGSTVYYSISGPCYLNTAGVALDIVKYAISLWSEDIPLFFKEADGAHPPNLVISFGSVVDSSDEAKKSLAALDVGPNKTYPFQLSHVEIPWQPSTETPIKIILDTDWAFWMLQDTPQTQNPYSIKDFFGAFYIFIVLLHDIGTALGLLDSSNPDDVMSPYYSESHTQLSPNDTERIKRIYPWLK
ncbi:hypothetical protein VaNZ11_016392 [Volvox africanus]|uniref:Tyrosinase copper-binding domain-containing protein n=1 Tax=Volvox africanus TaxID=51714 RepID=A0ABQ5SP08_9CHLO|nr:hypothetical protein VaNZ11_016392 [Volvox africanus]